MTTPTTPTTPATVDDAAIEAWQTRCEDVLRLGLIPRLDAAQCFKDAHTMLRTLRAAVDEQRARINELDSMLAKRAAETRSAIEHDAQNWKVLNKIREVVGVEHGSDVIEHVRKLLPAAAQRDRAAGADSPCLIECANPNCPYLVGNRVVCDKCGTVQPPIAKGGPAGDGQQNGRAVLNRAAAGLRGAASYVHSASYRDELHEIARQIDRMAAALSASPREAEAPKTDEHRKLMQAVDAIGFSNTRSDDSLVAENVQRDLRTIREALLKLLAAGAGEGHV